MSEPKVQGGEAQSYYNQPPQQAYQMNAQGPPQQYQQGPPQEQQQQQQQRRYGGGTYHMLGIPSSTYSPGMGGNICGGIFNAMIFGFGASLGANVANGSFLQPILHPSSSIS
jgi:hypothetical protein